MAVSGLLTSWATPETSCPDGGHLFRVDQLGLQHGGVGDVGHHDHDAGDDALLIAHGTEVDGELADPAIAAQDLQIEVVDVVSGERGVEGVGEHGRRGGRDEIGERTANQLPLLVAGVVPAAVGIADESGRVDDQNQALRVVQDLLGEIALALQFGLVGLKAGDVEHQAAVLQHLAVGVAEQRRR